MVSITAKIMGVAAVTVTTGTVIVLIVLRRKMKQHEDQQFEYELEMMKRESEIELEQRLTMMHTVTLLPLDVQVIDKQLALEWRLEASHTQCLSYEDGASPTALMHFVGVCDVSKPQLNILTEENFGVPVSSEEYMRRSTEHLPPAAEVLKVGSIDTLLKDVKDFSGVDAFFFAFSQPVNIVGRSMYTAVLNFVICVDNVAIVVQLMCRAESWSMDHHLPMYGRVCRAIASKVALPSCIISERRRSNYLRVAVPCRNRQCGWEVMVPAYFELKMHGHTNDARFTTALNQLLGTKKRDHCRPSYVYSCAHGEDALLVVAQYETSHRMVIALSHFGIKVCDSTTVAVSNLEIQELNHSIAVGSDLNRGLLLIAFAEDVEMAKHHCWQVLDTVTSYVGTKRKVSFSHGPSCISYSFPFADNGEMFNQYFGIYNFIAFPYGAEKHVSVQVRVKSISEDETFNSLQNEVVADIGGMPKRPTHDGWSLVESSTWVKDEETDIDIELEQHLTMLEHGGYFVALVWSHPKNSPCPHTIDDIKKNLRLPSSVSM